MEPKRLPRENLVRAISQGFEFREMGDGKPPQIFGHFARFSEWTLIDSMFEGRFMEQIAPGAFKKTFSEGRDRFRILFQHGQDPTVGDKPLASVTDLREDDEGAYYEGDMLDTSYNRDLLPGLQAGVYGASFRFRVMREDLVEEPGTSDHNPAGLPERTIREAEVMEAGPCTFPAYAGATASVRSLTDEFLFSGFTRDPKRLVELIDNVRAKDKPAVAPPAPSIDPAPAVATPDPERRDVPTPKEDPKEDDVPPEIDRFKSLEELHARHAEIQARLQEISAEWGVRALDADTSVEFDELAEERSAIEERVADVEQRLKVVGETAKDERKVEREPVGRSFQAPKSRLPDNIHDIEAYRVNARTAAEHTMLLRDGAMRSVEGADFPTARSREEVQTHIERLLRTIDEPNEALGKSGSELARRILLTGSEVYRRAFGKFVLGRPMSPEEQRALSFTSAATGAAAVVYQLDPTIVPTSNSSVNPMRAIARVETISGTNEFKFVTSGAITAAYGAEATEATDNAPTLAQPDIIVEKAQAYVPFSIEIGQDWGALETEMGALFQDAKDDLEATKFLLGAGHGSTEPKGLIVGATATTTAGGVGAFAIADLYKAWEALPPRFRPRAQWIANLFTFDKVRQFDTAGGSGVWQWKTSLNGGQLAADLASNPSLGRGGSSGNLGALLLGRETNEATAMVAALTTGSKILVVGDMRYFVIVDRIGMDVEVVPLVVGTNHRPTGQRGLYAYWRNSSEVLSAAAFQVLVTG
jgi:HK97 family phage major capsid protein/HK97 family phage prohead protease